MCRHDLLTLTLPRAGRDRDVLGLVEVGDRHAEIRDLPGYRTLVDGSRQSSDHVALLVRDDLRVGKVTLTRISPARDVERIVAGARKDGRAEAKYILAAVLPDLGVEVGVTHFVPSSTKLRAFKARRLYREQAAAAAKWLAAGDRVLLGDFNGTPDYRLLAPLRKVARPLSRPSHGKRAIDQAWVPKDATGVHVEALDGFHSDHRPVAVTLTLKEIR